jgi:hypothetical protein
MGKPGKLGKLGKPGKLGKLGKWDRTLMTQMKRIDADFGEWVIVNNARCRKSDLKCRIPVGFCYDS